ncbi:putative lipid II flippase FtsW [Limnobacter humi]|uniref:Probable peptidoglycan glycosyltransferase FtsW n=1 Tax=Limnobacter humi TaxID=1778671 RepID=A0ABT1WI31_9BURK|nr:putative lipid II flippase FtsW [Limnobacter humi]MCQ8897074.1 putative lipid II flippase FtsW [Limnobacter humi]
MLNKWFKRERSSLPTHSLIPAGVAGASSAYGLGRGNTQGVGQQHSVDQSLVWAVLALLFLGLVMVYSATVALPDSNKYANYSTTHFLVRHAVSFLVAFAAAFFAFQIPMKSWQQLAPLLFLSCLGLLLLVLIPGVGKDVNGARRWLSLYVLNIQPSELMKVCAIIYAADYTVRKQAYMQRIGKVLLPMIVAMFLVGMLLLLEPDMGAFIVIVTVVFAILFLGGINAKVFLGSIGMLSAAFALLIAFSDYRRARLLAYLDPWSGDNAQNKAYQLSHSLIAFGRGEVFGVGLGGSVEKLHYLPEAHTDFILAVIGEELGFVGVTIVILLFAFIVRRCFAIGSQAIALERTFSGLFAKGVGTWIGVQTFINMGVNLGLLPTKGLTLPLMSYGGSAIMMNCVALALVLRVDYENRTMMRGGAA